MTEKASHDTANAGAANAGAARVVGWPGERVRLLGFLSIFWPLPAALVLCGWFLCAALPVPGLPRAVAAIALFALCAAARVFSDAFATRFSRFVKGARGEELVARELALLPAEWTVLHGVPRRGRAALRGGGDVDHVLVGPSGVFAVETKNWSGPVSISGPEVLVGGAPVHRSPIVQVRREAAELARDLHAATPGSVPVRGVVCFAGAVPDPPEADVDGTLLVSLERLRASVLAHPAASEFGPEARAAAVSALMRRFR